MVSNFMSDYCGVQNVGTQIKGQPWHQLKCKTKIAWYIEINLLGEPHYPTLLYYLSQPSSKSKLLVSNFFSVEELIRSPIPSISSR
jgi:hypothetical protein